MHNYYEDIRQAVGDKEPLWYDEHGVPRYAAFHPRLCADIYAREAALLIVKCQSCGKAFLVADSWGSFDQMRGLKPLSERIAADEWEYGDPPNARCCPAGPTMNSIPHSCAQFWRRESHEWVQDPRLERSLACAWADEDPLEDDLLAGPRLSSPALDELEDNE